MLLKEHTERGSIILLLGAISKHCKLLEAFRDERAFI
jgi:hypothetical protein